jgi:glycosyltransferase involved in cell wall biosynthesis
LLVNNNAPEDAGNLADHWAGTDDRIKHVHEKVQGISHALNTGIRSARAPLIARMDADDISLPQRLSKQLKSF